MIYIYRPNVSDGAQALEDALNDQGCPARFTRGKLLRERFRPDRDKLVCWGAQWPGIAGLNNVEQIGKFTEATKLKEAGVPTVEVSRTRPAVVPVLDLMDIQAGRLTRQQLQALAGDIQRFLNTPPPAPVEWLPRRNNHIGGADLLRPGQADYFSKKENIISEYRIHIFQGKSIRAGQKKHREEFTNPHPWVRSYEAGWFIDYSGFSSTKAMREIAAKAVEALGLDFGAVDLGQKEDGSLLVFEVNRAPGIEGGTVESYAEKIYNWANGELRRAA